MPERVEFKVFTKMTKESIIDFKELITYAQSLGINKLAITDFNNVYQFPKIEKYLKTNNIRDVKIIYGAVVNTLIFETIIPITILVKNQKGLKNLYQIITKIKTTNLVKYKKELITKDNLSVLSDGLLFGLDLIYMQDIYANLKDTQIKDDLLWWDFIEVNSCLDKTYLKRLINIAKSLNKLVIASNHVCYLKKEEEDDYKLLFKNPNIATYLKSSKKMLKDFQFLNENLAYELVITNPGKLARLITDVKILPDKYYLPKIKNSKKQILTIINSKVNEVCGKNIPDIIAKRINEELYGKAESNNYGILNTHTESLFLIAKKLVDKSFQMGYPSFPRGGVASSFIAYLIGITSINPLPPHYYCPKCQKFYFTESLTYKYGIDMPGKTCTDCHNELKKDGFNIPYTDFLGSKNSKIPDIDLNFAYSIQKDLIKFLTSFWGKDYTIRSGALALTKAINPLESFPPDLNISSEQQLRLTKFLQGHLKHTGQLPGGVFLIPKDKEIYEFTPCNYPNSNNKYNYLTTHFDYHDLTPSLIKIDILGHFLPDLIKDLEDLTHIKLKDVPLNEQGVFTLINNHDVKDLFELDDEVAKSLIDIIKPHNFNDLTKIIGLLHSENREKKIQLIFQNKELINSLKIFREDISSQENLEYIPLKSHIISYTLITYKFAWYKFKFPEIFLKVIRKYQE